MENLLVTIIFSFSQDVFTMSWTTPNIWTIFSSLPANDIDTSKNGNTWLGSKQMTFQLFTAKS